MTDEMTEGQAVDTPKKRKGLLAFYVATGVALALFVGGWFAWTPIARRWRFERQWTARRVDVDFVEAPVCEVINFAQAVSDINILIVGDSVRAENPVSIKLENATAKELTLRALKEAGIQHRIYAGNVLLLYDPDSQAYREFLAGGLRWGPGSSSVRAALQEKTVLEFTEDPASKAFQYMSGVTGVGHETELADTEKSRPVTVRLSGVTGAEAWDICLRHAGMIGEVRGENIHIRRLAPEKQEAAK